MKVLKSFAHVRLTALMERYAVVCPKSGWDRLRVVPNFIRKHQRWQTENSLKNKRVFGVPIRVNMERTGHAIPVPIYQVVNCLRENSHIAVGIFRKNGSKAQMNQMREAIESGSCISSFITVNDSNDVINLADLLKQYFRELPECLLTNKLSNTLIDIFTCTLSVYPPITHAQQSSWLVFFKMYQKVNGLMPFSAACSCWKTRIVKCFNSF